MNIVEATKLRLAGENTELLSPPLPESELQRAEKLLGFELPPLLRELYAGVADGGYNRMLGLLVPQSLVDPDDPCIVTTYLAWTAELPPGEPPWPMDLLPIAYHGGDTYDCIDCSQPELPVIRFDPVEEPYFGPASFRPVAESFAIWWQEWLDGR